MLRPVRERIPPQGPWLIARARWFEYGWRSPSKFVSLSINGDEGGLHVHYREFLNPQPQQLSAFLQGLCQVLHIDFETIPHGRLSKEYHPTSIHGLTVMKKTPLSLPSAFRAMRATATRP